MNFSRINFSRFSFPRVRRHGFTIIELLVAVGVTALLVALMLTMTVNIVGGWNRSTGRLSNASQARLVLDQLATDLQGAVMRRDSGTTNTWLAATLQGNPSVTEYSGLNDAPFAAAWSGTVKPIAANGSFFPGSATDQRIENYKFGQGGVWLRFFTIPAAGTAPRAVSYQMVRAQIRGSNQYTYTLFRSEVDANATFSAGYDLFMDRATSPGYNNNGAAASGAPGNIRRPLGERVIAVNVVDFGLKLYNSSGQEIFPVRRDLGASPPMSSDIPFTVAASTRTANPTSTQVLGLGAISYAYPASADLLVRVLSPEGVRLISALEGGNLANPDGLNTDQHWWRIVEQHSQVFTRRVELKSTPL